MQYKDNESIILSVESSCNTSGKSEIKLEYNNGVNTVSITLENIKHEDQSILDIKGSPALIQYKDQLIALSKTIIPKAKLEIDIEDFLDKKL